jgi:hypothetical protein
VDTFFLKTKYAYLRLLTADLQTRSQTILVISDPSSPESARSFTPTQVSTYSPPRRESIDMVMDISSSSEDEGQITDPDQFTTPPDVQVLDDSDDEEYEPQLNTDFSSQAITEGDTNNNPSTTEMMEGVDVQSEEIMHDTQGNVEQASQVAISHDSSLEEGELSGGGSPRGSVDSDDYEPPEALVVVDNHSASEVSEAFSPRASLEPERVSAPREKSSHSPMGLADTELLMTISEPVIGQSQPQDLVDLTVDTNGGPVEPLPLEVRVIPSWCCIANAPLQVEDTTASKQTSQFTPYESPLKMFTAYRYHPKYVSEVSGGFRSLTYSHQINPKEPLCRWELAGGTCNDGSCKFQHFRNMPLSGAFLRTEFPHC